MTITHIIDLEQALSAGGCVRQAFRRLWYDRMETQYITDGINTEVIFDLKDKGFPQFSVLSRYDELRFTIDDRRAIIDIWVI